MKLSGNLCIWKYKKDKKNNQALDYFPLKANTEARIYFRYSI